MIDTQGLGRREIVGILKRFRQPFLMVAGMSSITNALMLVPTLYMLWVYDRVMVSRNEWTLLAVSLIAFFLLLVMAACEWTRSRILVRLGVQLDEQLSSRVFEASFLAHRKHATASPALAFSDLTEIRQFLTGNGVYGVFDAPWALIYLAVLFLLHPYLGLLALVFMGVQIALAWWGNQVLSTPSKIATQAQSEATAFLHAKLRNLEVVESLGMAPRLKARWQTRYQAAVNKAGTAQEISHRITALSKFVRYSQQSLSLGAGALLVIDGQISPGSMIAANVLTTRALAPIDLIASTWKTYLAARGAMNRLETLLQRHPAVQLFAKNAPLKGHVELRNVSATVEDTQVAILKNVSLSLNPGDIHVVMGPSGSGKSTLAKVIVGIWPNTQGNVLVDGMPLVDKDRQELGPLIGYLPQDIALLDGSISENISRFGKINADAVIAASQLSGLHPMILRLPKGYDTVIGPSDRQLSGGQRQRLGLARAVYGEPMLIVLDEPNANLDEVGEAALAQAILSLKQKGKTIVLVTQRPGILSIADKLVILRSGQVTFAGPRDQVLAQLRAAKDGSEIDPMPASSAT